MSTPGTTRTPSAPSALDRYFEITARGSTVAREVRGGVVTFLTMAYIIVLNPLILGLVPDSTGAYLGGGSEPNLPAVAAGTALVAGVLTILMGSVAKFPLALAAGLGLNAFVAFSIATVSTWEAAMGLVVLEGVVILVLVLTGFRSAVFHAVPNQLKVAISVGIGLFIALIGFVDAGFVRPGAGTPVQLGATGQLSGWPVLVFSLGLLLLIALWVRRVKGAILLAIAVTTLGAFLLEAALDLGARDVESNPGGWGLTVPTFDGIVDVPDFGTLFRVDLFGAFSAGAVGVIGAILLVFSLMLADFFDTMGTMTAIGAEAGLNDEEGVPPRTQRILVVDSVAALVPRAEIDGEMGDAPVGLRARLMSQDLWKLTAVVSKSRTCLIFINQLRVKIGVMFGNPETTTGGRALKFYASIRIDIRRIGAIKDGDQVIGNRTRVKVVKNKCAPPFRQAEFDIQYDQGISHHGLLVDLGVEHEIVDKSGSWFSYGDQRIGQVLARGEQVQIAPAGKGRAAVCLVGRAAFTGHRHDAVVLARNIVRIVEA